MDSYVKDLLEHHLGRIDAEIKWAQESYDSNIEYATRSLQKRIELEHQRSAVEAALGL